MDSNDKVNLTPSFPRRPHNRTLQSGRVISVPGSTVNNHPSVYQHNNVQPPVEVPNIKSQRTVQNYAFALTSQLNNITQLFSITGSLLGSADLATWDGYPRFLQKKKLKKFAEKNTCEKCQQPLSGGDSFLPNKNDLNDAYTICPNCRRENIIPKDEYMSFGQRLRKLELRLMYQLKDCDPLTDEYANILDSLKRLSDIRQ